MSDDVLALERRLLDPAVRADQAAVERLLHRELCEVGALAGSLRSSRRVRGGPEGWQVLFHQGTPAA